MNLKMFKHILLLISFAGALILLTLPHAKASFIEIEQGQLQVNHSSDLNRELGNLGSGSVIEIPSFLKVHRGNGSIDLDRTLNRWDQFAESNPRLGAQFINGRKFYPVRIRKQGESNLSRGTIVYAPLDYLNSDAMKYRTVDDMSDVQDEDPIQEEKRPEKQVVASPSPRPQAPAPLADDADYGSATVVEDVESGADDSTFADLSQVDLPTPTRRPEVRPTPAQPSGNADPAGKGKAGLNIDDNYKFVTPKSGSLKNLCTGASQYFQSNGSLGKKGKILKRELTHGKNARSTDMTKTFFRTKLPGMSNICPKFNSFSDNQKLNFWIWYIASIAKTESGCGRNAYNPTDPHGVSIGELQMPDSWENRKFRGVSNRNSGAGGCWATPPPTRPPSYSYKNVPATLMAQTENNLTCGVEVLGGVLCGFYKHPVTKCSSKPQRPYGHGFWAELRKNSGGKIIRDVRTFPSCK